MCLTLLPLMRREHFEAGVLSQHTKTINSKRRASDVAHTIIQNKTGMRGSVAAGSS